MLMIGPSSVILVVILVLVLVITALVLASKNKSNTRFLSWGTFILAVPFIGDLVCFISYYSGKNKIKTL
jgi:type II secretory pathway component PulF